MDTLFQESYVKHTPFYHEGVSPIRLGEAGVPTDYSVISDDYVAVGALLLLLVSILTLTRSWRFVCFHGRNLLRTPRENSIEMRETMKEVQYQIYFWVQGVIILGVCTFMLSREYFGTSYSLDVYPMMGVFTACFAAYYAIMELLYLIVHPVFFTKQQRHLMGLSRVFLTATQGAVLLPIMLLGIYEQLNPENVLRSVLFIVISTLLLRFYKVYCIFFKKNGRFLQFFLYLCTLEAVPLVILIGGLYAIVHFLKINI